jgi:hypothetical protein
MQDPCVNSIVGLWTVSLFFKLLDNVPHHLCPLARLQLVLSMLQKFQDPFA